MNDKLEILKKRLIYRASYRGTKEMDILLSAFVNKYINEFDENLLVDLENFLNFEDEIIFIAPPATKSRISPAPPQRSRMSSYAL